MSTARSSQEQIDPRESNAQYEAFFMELLEKYQDAIFRFLYFRVNTRAVALDITQDTFTRVWQYLAGGKHIEYPEAFIYRAAKNALIDYYKKEKASSLDTMLEGGFDPASHKDTDEILRQDDIATVQDILAQLDEESRQILFLRYTEEKPIEEIAALYGKSTNAMTVHIHRLIKKLRSKYDTKQDISDGK